jgi:hypothetical protein
VKRYPQCVDAVAIRKIVFVEDDRSGTDVQSASSDTEAIERPEVLRRPSVGTVAILVRYRVSFSTAFVPQLQLRHLRWLASVQSVDDVPFLVP